MPSIDAEDEGSAEDQAYFRALEEAFLRLRGKATLLAAADWQVASEWRRSGVPLELVVATMEALFERQRSRRPRRGISSLAYFRAAVAAAWEEALALRAGGAVSEGPAALSVTERLAHLAQSLPETLPGREATAAALRALQGEAAEVEPRLAELDRRLLDRLLGETPATDLEAMAREVTRLLAVHGGRLAPAEAEATRARLLDQALRRRWRLPVLSLFSPEAQAPPED